MPKYRVIAVETVSYRGVVEADSPEEARALDPDDLDLEEFDSTALEIVLVEDAA